MEEPSRILEQLDAIRAQIENPRKALQEVKDDLGPLRSKLKDHLQRQSLAEAESSLLEAVSALNLADNRVREAAWRIRHVLKQ